jgi:hypothetical protein
MWQVALQLALLSYLSTLELDILADNWMQQILIMQI